MVSVTGWRKGSISVRVMLKGQAIPEFQCLKEQRCLSLSCYMSTAGQVGLCSVLPALLTLEFRLTQQLLPGHHSWQRQRKVEAAKCMLALKAWKWPWSFLLTFNWPNKSHDAAWLFKQVGTVTLLQGDASNMVLECSHYKQQSRSNKLSARDKGFTNKLHKNPEEDLLKYNFLGPIPSYPNLVITYGAQECAFLISPQVMLIWTRLWAEMIQNCCWEAAAQTETTCPSLTLASRWSQMTSSHQRNMTEMMCVTSWIKGAKKQVPFSPTSFWHMLYMLMPRAIL